MFTFIYQCILILAEKRYLLSKVQLKGVLIKVKIKKNIDKLGKEKCGQCDFNTSPVMPSALHCPRRSVLSWGGFENVSDRGPKEEDAGHKSQLIKSIKSLRILI